MWLFENTEWKTIWLSEEGKLSYVVQCCAGKSLLAGSPEGVRGAVI